MSESTPTTPLDAVEQLKQILKNVAQIELSNEQIQEIIAQQSGSSNLNKTQQQKEQQDSTSKPIKNSSDMKKQKELIHNQLEKQYNENNLKNFEYLALKYALENNQTEFEKIVQKMNESDFYCHHFTSKITAQSLIENLAALNLDKHLDYFLNHYEDVCFNLAMLTEQQNFKYLEDYKPSPDLKFTNSFVKDLDLTHAFKNAIAFSNPECLKILQNWISKHPPKVKLYQLKDLEIYDLDALNTLKNESNEQEIEFLKNKKFEPSLNYFKILTGTYLPDDVKMALSMSWVKNPEEYKQEYEILIERTPALKKEKYQQNFSNALEWEKRFEGPYRHDYEQAFSAKHLIRLNFYVQEIIDHLKIKNIDFIQSNIDECLQREQAWKAKLQENADLPIEIKQDLIQYHLKLMEPLISSLSNKISHNDYLAFEQKEQLKQSLRPLSEVFRMEPQKQLKS